MSSGTGLEHSGRFWKHERKGRLAAERRVIGSEIQGAAGKAFLACWYVTRLHFVHVLCRPWIGTTVLGTVLIGYSFFLHKEQRSYQWYSGSVPGTGYYYSSNNFVLGRPSSTY